MQIIRLIAITIALLLPAPAALFAQAVKDLPRPTDYVSDDGHVLSAETKQHLNMLCGAVERQTHAQIAVVTVQNTDDEPIADYAVQLEDAWKVGAKGTDRGVILLVSIGDRKWFISTGYGLEGVLTDERVGIIGRQMQQYLRVSQNDEGLTLGTEQIASLIAQAAGVQLQAPREQVVPDQHPVQHLGKGQLAILFGVFVLLFVLAARTGMLPFLFGMFLGGGFGGGGGGGGRNDDDGDGFSGFGGGGTGGGGAGGSF